MIEQRELVVNDYTLRGLFTTPEGTFQDLVVMFHGYTGHKNENGYLFKTLSQILAQNGVASLRFDFMGSGDSDGAFVEFNFFTEMTDGTHIIDEAVRLNQNRPIILLGFSMGGAVAARVSLLKQNQIQKMILLSPAGNMPTIIENTFQNNPVDENGNVDMGGYFLNRQFLDAFAHFDMYHGLEQFQKPVLLMHGSLDQAVPFEYGEKYHQLFPTSVFHLVDGAPHGYNKVCYRQFVNQTVLDFIKKE